MKLFQDNVFLKYIGSLTELAGGLKGHTQGCPSRNNIQNVLEIVMPNRLPWSPCHPQTLVLPATHPLPSTGWTRQ